MRSRRSVRGREGQRDEYRDQDEWESFDPVRWPESSVEIDDDAFARAIAEGRGAHAAA